MPEAEGIAPDYEQKLFAPEDKNGKLKLVASRDGRDGSLKIHQNVSVYNAVLRSGEAVEHQLGAGRHAWLQVVKGTVNLQDNRLAAGDGAAVSEESALIIQAVDESEVILFDLA